jgi:hypothetical protein
MKHATSNPGRLIAVVLWPFRLLAVILGTLLEVMGRMALVILALSVLLIGALLLMTGFGAMVGMVFLLLGFALLLRALF